MPTIVGIREFSKDPSRFIKEVEQSGQPVLITRYRHPAVMLVPAEGAMLEEFERAGRRELDDILHRLETDEQESAT